MMSFFGKIGKTLRGAKGGFTLIELLVVIAIIGVLASIVLASLNSARRKARDARRIADIKELQLALELFFDSNNAYPAALAGDTNLTGNTCGGSPCIVAIPQDPNGTGNDYRYCRFGSNLRYHIGASLEEADNNALDNDSDAANPCANGTISGLDAGSCLLATDTTLHCYNVGM